MFRFFKKKRHSSEEKARESPEVVKARRYLEKLHLSYSLLGQIEPFHYIQTSEKGSFKRYHFYQGDDKRLVYVVLSDEERNEILKMFKEKMGEKGDSYAYQDTILMGENEFQHRFYRPKAFNTSITFMTDDGEIWGGNFAMDEDLSD